MSTPSDTLVFKLATVDEWSEAVVLGVYGGSSDDLRDGFIHLSSEPQLAATAKKYFSGVEDLCLIAFAASDLGSKLRWETSRGGDLFPHYYGELPAPEALWVQAVPLDADGIPLLPDTGLAEIDRPPAD